MKHKAHWVDVKESLPNFIVFGFHRRKIMVRLQNGDEIETSYQGYGEFGGFGNEKEVTHYLCDELKKK